MWRAAVALVAAVPALGVGAAPASATTYYPQYSNDYPQYSNESETYSSWFFGRTTICVQNPTPNPWAVDESSALWFSWGTVAAHSTVCMTRSFVGLGVDVAVFDVNQAAPVGDCVSVYKPIGP